MDSPIPPRILRVRYRSRHWPRRVAEAWIKVPYGGVHGLYALAETLSRAVQTRQVMWFRIEAPEHIPPEKRAILARWPEALKLTSESTGVTWE